MFGPNLTNVARRRYIDKPKSDRAGYIIKDKLTRGEMQSIQVSPIGFVSSPGYIRRWDRRYNQIGDIIYPRESANNSDFLRYVREDSTGHQETRPETHEE